MNDINGQFPSINFKPKISIKAAPAKTKKKNNITKVVNKNKLPLDGPPDGTLKAPNGNERVYGSDGWALKDIDWNHPQHHPELPNPHNHDWSWDGDVPKRSGAYDPNTTEKIIISSIVIYGGYQLIKWGLATILAPATGGASWGVAFVMP